MIVQSMCVGYVINVCVACFVCVLLSTPRVYDMCVRCVSVCVFVLSS